MEQYLEYLEAKAGEGKNEGAAVKADMESGEEVMKLFKRINEEKGITILQVTHSAECTGYGSRIVEIKNGRIA